MTHPSDPYAARVMGLAPDAATQARAALNLAGLIDDARVLAACDTLIADRRTDPETHARARHMKCLIEGEMDRG